MSENIRAFLVVLLLSALTFALIRVPARSMSPDHDFVRRRNVWFGVTSLAFLAHNFWLMAAGVVALVLAQRQREHNPVALWWLLLFAVPVFGLEIPGFGLVNYLFQLTYPRLLSLVLLLPAALLLLRQPGLPRPGLLWPDRLLLAYLALTTALYIRDTTFTDTLRAAFMLLLDVWLPYFVASRSIVHKGQMKDVLLSMLVGIGVMASVAVFELAKGWLLYSSLKQALDVPFGLGGYLGREGLLRANASTGQSIVMGYVAMVGLGAFLYLRHWVAQAHWRWLGGLLVLGGLLAPLSRGPWVGALTLLLVYAATAPQAGKKLAWLLAGLAAALPVLMVAPIGNGRTAIDLLPFVGTTDSFNVDYRERLLEMGTIVIERNFWFGSVDYLNTPEMLSMIQGQGIIDLVNSYLGIALEVGVVGLGLFMGFFASVAAPLFWHMRAQQAPLGGDPELAIMGQALLATLAGILLTIYTVSSISHIPYVYWAFAGLCVGYRHLRP